MLTCSFFTSRPADKAVADAPIVLDVFGITRITAALHAACLQYTMISHLQAQTG